MLLKIHNNVGKKIVINNKILDNNIECCQSMNQWRANRLYFICLYVQIVKETIKNVSRHLNARRFAGKIKKIFIMGIAI